MSLPESLSQIKGFLETVTLERGEECPCQIVRTFNEQGGAQLTAQLTDKPESRNEGQGYCQSPGVQFRVVQHGSKLPVTRNLYVAAKPVHLFFGGIPILAFNRRLK